MGPKVLNNWYRTKLNSPNTGLGRSAMSQIQARGLPKWPKSSPGPSEFRLKTGLKGPKSRPRTPRIGQEHPRKGPRPP